MEIEKDTRKTKALTSIILVTKNTKLFVAIVLVIAALVPATFVLATTTTMTQAGQKIAETQALSTQFVGENNRGKRYRVHTKVGADNHDQTRRDNSSVR